LSSFFLRQSTDLAYQHTSKAIPWFVAEIVKRREENQLSGGEGILQVKEFLKQVENGDGKISKILFLQLF
jgi:hypothetical protein